MHRATLSTADSSSHCIKSHYTVRRKNPPHCLYPSYPFISPNLSSLQASTNLFILVLLRFCQQAPQTQLFPLSRAGYPQSLSLHSSPLMIQVQSTFPRISLTSPNMCPGLQPNMHFLLLEHSWLDVFALLYPSLEISSNN